MALILDTGPIVAALNAADANHRRCAALLGGGDDLVVPGPVLVEVDHWLIKLGGPRAWADFVADVTGGAYRVVHPTEADLVRATELERDDAELDLGFVDASIVALCERLGETRLATLDRRVFSVVRPRHCRQLTLVPD
ncbi:MAG: PIN domain-containing protein [Candidatus Dormibacteria bacterium]|jgi:predicted nucleic acid-binding protein